MGTYKTNIYKLNRKFDYHYKPIAISFNVEHIMLIANIINTVKCLFYISETSPLAFLHNGCPLLQSDLNVRMPFGIFLQSLFCKYSHRAILTV